MLSLVLENAAEEELSIKGTAKQLRTCVACRKKASRDELLRFVLSDKGKPAFDKTKRRPGRGVWTHSATECFEKAVERGQLTRGLRVPKGVQSTEVVNNLRKSVAVYLDVD